MEDALTAVKHSPSMLRTLPREADSPGARYMRALPEEVAQGLAPFRHGRLAVLQVCAASRRAVQRLRNAPLLLWLREWLGKQ